MKSLPSPAARLFTGLRQYLDVAQRLPLFARFITRVGPQAIGPDNLVYKYIPIHIEEGIRAGEFVDAPVGVALDMVVGVGLIAIARISAGRVDDAYLSAMLLALARSLGSTRLRAETLLSEPVEPLDLSADSLLVRSDARFRKQKRRKRR